MLPARLLKRPLLFAGVAAVATAAAVVVPAAVISSVWFSARASVGAAEVATVVALVLLTALLAATFTLSGPESAAESGVLRWFVTSCPVSNQIAFSLVGASVIVSWFVPALPLLAAPVIAGAVCAVGVRGHLVRRTGISCPLPPVDVSSSSPTSLGDLTRAH